MRRTYGWLLASVGLVLGGCTGDEFLVGGDDTGSGGGASTTGATTAAGPATSSTTSTSSGGCDGCLKDGVCLPGNAIDACGANGATCQSCAANGPCSTSSCSADQACVTTPSVDGTACEFVPGDPTSGACTTGECREASEKCLNREDDDEDGKVDCLDTDCDASFQCTDDAPDGWTGPVAVYAGAVACPTVWGAAVAGTFGTGVAVSALDCSACACTTTCAGTVEVGVGAACAIDGADVDLTPGGCDLLEDLSVASQFAAAPASTPTCDVTPPDPSTFPAPSFETVYTLCQGTPEVGAGCDVGACRPKAPDVGGVIGAVCVYQTGDHNCPSPFTTKRTIASSFDDTRACNCTCEDPTCGGDVQVFTNDTCDACNGSATACATLAMDDAAGCEDALPVGTELYGSWAPEAACTPGGAGEGAVAEGGLITVCCL